jgi:hypothetical protein
MRKNESWHAAPRARTAGSLFLAMLLATTVFGAVLAHAQTQPAQAKPAGPQFVKFSTEHFDVELDQSVAEYRPYVEVHLELGYRMFQKYTGVDYNTMMNKVNVADVHKPRYLYQLPTSDYMWNKGWGGGLTIWNKSQMNANLVKTLDEKSMRTNQHGLSILWHELANGWSTVYASKDGKPTHCPGWFIAEGHAGFLRHHAMVDLGYPKNQIEEYKVAISQFDKYMAGQQHDPGGVCHVFLETLWQKYDWKPFRAVYDAIQKDGLTFPADNPEKANGMLLTIICRSVGENLLPFFTEHKVKVDDETAKQLSKLPQAKITVAREIWVPEAFRQKQPLSHPAKD